MIKVPLGCPLLLAGGGTTGGGVTGGVDPPPPPPPPLPEEHALEPGVMVMTSAPPEGAVITTVWAFTPLQVAVVTLSTDSPVVAKLLLDEITVKVSLRGTVTTTVVAFTTTVVAEEPLWITKLIVESVKVTGVSALYSRAAANAVPAKAKLMPNPSTVARVIFKCLSITIVNDFNFSISSIAGMFVDRLIGN